MNPPHLILPGWRFGAGSPVNANLICLTNHPTAWLIHDLRTSEFSSWLITPTTFTWPALACMVIWYTWGRGTDQTGSVQQKLKPSSITQFGNVQVTWCLRKEHILLIWLKEFQSAKLQNYKMITHETNISDLKTNVKEDWIFLPYDMLQTSCRKSCLNASMLLAYIQPQAAVNDQSVNLSANQLTQPLGEWLENKE